MKAKQWNGLPTALEYPTAASKERFNNTLDTPYQTASGPGFRADKKGAFSEVSVEVADEKETTLPSFYTMGRIDNVNRLSGSNKAKGKFRKLGQIDSADFSIPNINYVGGQWGVVPVNEGGDQWAFYKTKDAKRFTHAVSFVTGYSTGNRTLWRLVLGSQYKDRRSTLTWGICLNWYNGKEYTVYVYYDGEDQSWNQGSVLTYPDFDCGSTFEAIAPGKLIGFTSVLHNEEAIYDEAGNMVNWNPDNAPFPFFTRSNDKGKTWQYINCDEIFDDYATHASKGWINYDFGQMAYEADFYPITPYVTACTIPFTKHTEYNEHGIDADRYREFRAYQIVGSTVVHVATLDKNMVDPDKGYLSGGTTGTSTRCIVSEFIPYSPSANHVLCVSYNGGFSWSYKVLPWAAYCTGFTTWLDADKLVICAYDGVHSLFLSEDDGTSWEKVGTLREDGPAPFDFGSYLNAFSILRQFRREDGSAAAVTMGAEWISDGSVPYEP